jgi:hypothetical protein
MCRTELVFQNGEGAVFVCVDGIFAPQRNPLSLLSVRCHRGSPNELVVHFVNAARQLI